MQRSLEKTLLVITLFALVLLGAAGQSAYLENGVNGTGLTVDVAWIADKLAGFGFSAGYSISGILDLGMALNVIYDEIEKKEAREINGRILYNVFVFKQQAEIPLSLQIIGSYGLSRISSDPLEEQKLIRRGSGFTIGAILSTDFMLGFRWAIRLGLLADYRSYRYITETEIAIPEDSVYPVSQYEEELIYGGLVGVLLKPVMGPVVAVGLKGTVLASALRFEPFINMTQPIRR